MLFAITLGRLFCSFNRHLGYVCVVRYFGEVVIYHCKHLNNSNIAHISACTSTLRFLIYTYMQHVFLSNTKPWSNTSEWLGIRQNHITVASDYCRMLRLKDYTITMLAHERCHVSAHTHRCEDAARAHAVVHARGGGGCNTGELSNLSEPRPYITSISVAQSFCNFAQSTAVILPCSVQNFGTSWLLRYKLWANETLRDCSLNSKGPPIIQQPQPTCQ